MAYILVVDDEEPIRDVLRRRFHSWGHEVGQARTAEEALMAMEARPARIVFCDLIMPVHDGIWLMERIQERWQETVFIVISGGEDIGKIVKTRKLGAVDFVAKPLGREMVDQALQRALTVAESRS
jgi:DNA-binding NtrC family response regulator